MSELKRVPDRRESASPGVRLLRRVMAGLVPKSARKLANRMHAAAAEYRPS